MLGRVVFYVWVGGNLLVAGGLLVFSLLLLSAPAPLPVSIPAPLAQSAPPVPERAPSRAVPAPVIVPVTVPAPTTDHPSYAALLTLVEQGEWTTVRAQADGPSVPLNTLLRWLDLSRPNSGRSFADIRAFLTEHPDWPRPTLLHLRAEEAMTVTLDDAVALEWFERHPPQSADGHIRLTKALYNSDRPQDALASLRRTWIEQNFGPKQEDYFLRDHGAELTADDHWQRLDRLLWEGRSGPARRMLALVDDNRQALARARLALRVAAEDVDQTVAAVPAALADDPGLLFERLRWRLHRERYEEALALALPLTADRQPLPQERHWWRELYPLVRHLLSAGRMEDAYKLAALPRTHSDAAGLAGWLALRFLDRPREALAHFTLLYEHGDTPEQRARGAYWAGRAHNVLKDRVQAESWYRRGAVYSETYYGLLAASQLGLLIPRYPRHTPSPDAVQQFAARLPVQAARELAALGKPELAQTLVLYLGEDSSDPVQMQLVADLAAELGQPHWAVRAGMRLARRGLTVPDVAYPLLPVVRLMPEPEPALVHAVIHQESLFDPAARSPVGASGLMQLMPATARETASRLGMTYEPDYLTTRPAYNIRLGSAYLAGLIEQWQGSYVLAIASYNAGPGRVQSWINEFGDPRDSLVDTVDWIERIPYAETRNYVQRVLANLLVYRNRLGQRFALDLAQELERSYRVAVRY